MSHPSLLTAVHDVLAQSALPVQATKSVHPLSTEYTTVTAQLGAVINTTHRLNHALNQLNDLPLGENATKLVALMKEHTALTSSINQSTAASVSLSSLLRGDNRAIYPDASPPHPAKIAEWGRNLGMEVFVDGSTTVLAGKVLVLDIDINDHVAVKTSFANNANGNGNTSAAPELDAFLAQEVTRWINAARRAAGIDSAVGHLREDPAIEAARRSRAIQEHLRYLMMLDGLAAAENEKGLRWFMEPTVVSDHIRKQVVSPQMEDLDKFLTQHALPLPYLVAPSLSFIVWLSPRGYLQLLRSSPPSKQSSMWNIDIPIAHLKTSMLDTLEDVTIATLKLVPCTEVAKSKMDSSDVPGDHTLLAAPSQMWVLDFTTKLPQNGVVMCQGRMRVIQGIVESRPIDMISMGNMSSMGSMSSLGNMSNMNFGEFGVASSQTNGSGGTGRSWVDLLVNKNSSAEYYTATYKSPNDIHPPLHLRLLAPPEPGFLLQRVPVRSVKQVSRVLEVVRGQCWLNESLSILQWSPETAVLKSSHRPSNVEQGMPPEDAASTTLLASVLAGTVAPQSIPVNVYLPSSALSALSQPVDPFTSQHSGLGMGPPASAGSSSGASLFGPSDLEMEMDIPGLSMSMGGSMDMDLGMDLSTPTDPMQQSHGPETCPPPMIVLTSPMPVPRNGLVEIRITSGEGHGENGVWVEASPGVETGYMSDVVRRGGVWSLPGRVWNKG
ncbi:uncharacterized protein F5147DRAFT_687209 [Suillus discolor]|uniref:Mediator of RNA polymerase II transcription subunit 1 n=1 Tax=Suillus discolor TaxID=1912936 RepID=A0A9P7JW72_9AGAM|nr:uncharacterized protein F5147DRAFT_687209 [Suillus discolor]KAG2111314.1 hypothetical protein F5147DRAFT_687209 [Suillus discolor]